MTLIQTLCCTAALLAAGQAGAADLTIHVDDLKAAGGQLVVAVYNSAGAFMKTPVGSATAAAGSANTVVIKDLPAGEYAFSVLHDANSNGKMDKNLFGIPTESYAFSNNALGKMGPPSYEQARFTLPAAGTAVRVSLR